MKLVGIGPLILGCLLVSLFTPMALAKETIDFNSQQSSFNFYGGDIKINTAPTFTQSVDLNNISKNPIMLQEGDFRGSLVLNNLSLSSFGNVEGTIRISGFTESYYGQQHEVGGPNYRGFQIQTTTTRMFEEISIRVNKGLGK